MHCVTLNERQVTFFVLMSQVLILSLESPCLNIFFESTWGQNQTTEPVPFSSVVLSSTGIRVESKAIVSLTWGSHMGADEN